MGIAKYTLQKRSRRWPVGAFLTWKVPPVIIHLNMIFPYKQTILFLGTFIYETPSITIMNHILTILEPSLTIILIGCFHRKPSIWEYPYFRKPPVALARVLAFGLQTFKGLHGAVLIASISTMPKKGWLSRALGDIFPSIFHPYDIPYYYIANVMG